MTALFTLNDKTMQDRQGFIFLNLRIFAKEIKRLFPPCPNNDGKFTENTVDIAYK